MICFVMVVIAYALGHIGGYRICKYRILNMLRRKIQAKQPTDTPYAAAIAGVYSSLLPEVRNI